MTVKSQTLKVPGAQIYYEVYGSGPVLLMIPGGPADAGVFTVLAQCLADRYTCVPYDPRGNSRSLLDGPAKDFHLDLFGDDAAQLLAALGDQPAYVLGSSGGAQIGLNLAARYPERVRTLVADEHGHPQGGAPGLQGHGHHGVDAEGAHRRLPGLVAQ